MDINERGFKPEVLAEIREIHKRDGVLTPEALLTAAKKKTSALHSQFHWDDAEAAHLHRLDQAAGIIRRVTVYITMPEHKEIHVRAYVSLPETRGYQRTVEVLNNKQQREQLLAMALRELAAFKRKYAELSELTAVFDAMEQVPIKPRNKRKVVA